MLALRCVDEHGDLLPADDLVQIRLPVALEAFPIGCADDDVGLAHLVGLVAIGAGGDGPRLTLPQLPLDDLQVDLFYLGVALHAGPGDVPDGGLGFLVGMRENKVVPVAVVAGRRDDETLLEEAFAVNALGVV